MGSLSTIASSRSGRPIPLSSGIAKTVGNFLLNAAIEVAAALARILLNNPRFPKLFRGLKCPVAWLGNRPASFPGSRSLSGRRSTCHLRRTPNVAWPGMGSTCRTCSSAGAARSNAECERDIRGRRDRPAPHPAVGLVRLTSTKSRSTQPVTPTDVDAALIQRMQRSPQLQRKHLGAAGRSSGVRGRHSRTTVPSTSTASPPSCLVSSTGRVSVCPFVTARVGQHGSR